MASDEDMASLVVRLIKIMFMVLNVLGISNYDRGKSGCQLYQYQEIFITNIKR